MSATFYLYRLKIERSREPSLFDDQTSSPGEIIRAAIEEKPSKEIRKGNTWHVGNIENLNDQQGMFFAFGRVTKSIVEKFDEEEGNFREEDDEQAPYTYVVLDLHYQVCAVAHKSKIAPKVSQIASNLAKLLNETQKAKENNLKFVMAGINDPSAFLEYIQNAYAIKKFDIAFSPPNPWDVDKDFQEPMQNLLGATGGKKGKTSIEGESLEKEPIEKLAAAAAATGNSASARIEAEQGQPFETKKIEGNPTTLHSDDFATIDEKKNLLGKIVELYQSVRNPGIE